MKYKKRVTIETRKIGEERNEGEYDHVWTNDEYVEQYNQDHKLFYHSILNDLEILLREEYINTIADIGCGPGNLLKLISEKWPDKCLYGYDFSGKVIEKNKIETTSINFCSHNIYEPLTIKFDLVICSETLEHLLYPQKAIYNVLNATAKVCLLTVPDGRTDSYSGHINFWSEESWKIFLSEWQNKWEINTYKNIRGLSATLKRRAEINDCKIIHY